MKKVPLLLAYLALAGPAALAQPAHDLYVCAAINSSSRVMGGRSQTGNGIFRREADGSFAHVGLNYPLLMNVAFDPRDRDRFYVASLSGVLRTEDGGKSWRLVTGWAETEPKCVAVDPNAPDSVYAALPDGVIASRDRGSTWQRTETGLPDRGKYAQVVRVDRARAGRVLIGCETGIYLSEDAAGSWQRVFAATDTVTDIQQSPHDAAVWAATSQSAGALWSRDGGRTWTRLAGIPSEKALYNVAFDPTNPQRLAIASWSYGLWTSEDGGRSWVERNAGLPEPHRVWRTAVDPDNGRLYAAVTERALFASDDFGRTWQPAGLEGSVIQSFTFVPRAQH